ncbi:MAG TPA: TraR/DksA family transcriptional regulator [Aliiroseovarius sp.]|nr:TraR/DksA family transcriptional regulator [Aliiroseovarius sp.]
MIDIAKYRAKLEARQAELLARLEEIEAELESHHSKDWEDLATEREGDEVLEEEARLAREELAQIAAAFTRMEEGEYGYCVECGDEISPERLDILPATPFCRVCAAKHD